MKKTIRDISTKLSNVIANELREKILQEKLTPGSRFLSEKDVLDQWECSRATAREALLLLEYEGLVTSKPGPHGGFFVREPDTHSLVKLFNTFIDLNNITSSELLEARIEIESSCAFYAAKRATEADLEYIYDAMEKYEQAIYTKNDPPLHNVAFHIAVAAASHNHVLHLIMKMLEEMIYKIQSNTMYTAEQRKSVIQSHRLIYEAIASRDPEKASQEMYLHLSPFYKLRKKNKLE